MVRFLFRGTRIVVNALESFRFVFLKTLPTIYRSAAVRLKWNLGLFSTFCTRGWVHLTGRSILPSITSFSIHNYSLRRCKSNVTVMKDTTWHYKSISHRCLGEEIQQIESSEEDCFRIKADQTSCHGHIPCCDSGQTI